MPISSPFTAVAKFVWPVGWIGLMGWFTIGALTNSPGVRWSGGGPAPLWGKALLVVLLGLGFLVAWRVSRPLKKVRLGEGGVHASNYLTEIWIGWRDVRRVVVHGDFGPRRTPLVELELRERGAFGRRISLLPASPEALAHLEDSALAVQAIPWEHRPA